MSIEPFEVSIDEQVLQDLEDRIRNTRWADDFDNADWEYGTNGKYLKELCDFWNATLFPNAKSWYQGSNIPGKKEEPLNFPMGLPTYIQKFKESADNGYTGFTLS